MQVSLLQEKEKVTMLKQQNYSDLNIHEYKKQANDIKQISAVRDSLNVLMTRATQNDNHQPQSNYTSILNPAVQSNLNTFIKQQRDEVVRMSQSISFKNPSPSDRHTD